MLVLSAHLKRGAAGDAVSEALAGELQTLATWLDLESVAVERRGAFARPPAGAVGR